MNLRVDRAADPAVSGVGGGGLDCDDVVRDETAPGDGGEVVAGGGGEREGCGGMARLIGGASRVDRGGRGEWSHGTEGHEASKRSRETHQGNHLPHQGRSSWEQRCCAPGRWIVPLWRRLQGVLPRARRAIVLSETCRGNPASLSDSARHPGHHRVCHQLPVARPGGWSSTSSEASTTQEGPIP